MYSTYTYRSLYKGFESTVIRSKTPQTRVAVGCPNDLHYVTGLTSVIPETPKEAILSTFLEAINAAQALAASNQGYVQLHKDQLFSAALVYVIRTNIVPTAQNKLFEKFDGDIELTARKLKGTVHTAAAIFKIYERELWGHPKRSATGRARH